VRRPGGLVCGRLGRPGAGGCSRRSADLGGRLISAVAAVTAGGGDLGPHSVLALPGGGRRDSALARACA
jgi:hypothetical protein